MHMHNARRLFTRYARPRILWILRRIIHHVERFLISIQRDWSRRRDVYLVARLGLRGTRLENLVCRRKRRPGERAQENTPRSIVSPRVEDDRRSSALVDSVDERKGEILDLLDVQDVRETDDVQDVPSITKSNECAKFAVSTSGIIEKRIREIAKGPRRCAKVLLAQPGNGELSGTRGRVREWVLEAVEFVRGEHQRRVGRPPGVIDGFGELLASDERGV